MKCILIGGGCLGVGFAVGYTIAKKKYIKKINAELEKIHKNNYDLTKVEEEPVKTQVSVEEVLDQDVFHKPEKDFVQTAQNLNESIKADRKRYENEVKQYATSSVEKEKQDNQEFVTMITPEEFMDSKYDALILYYHTDSVITDSDDNIYHMYMDMIGSEIKQVVDDPNYELASVYIKDDKLQKVFEVMIVDYPFNK